MAHLLHVFLRKNFSAGIIMRNPLLFSLFLLNFIPAMAAGNDSLSQPTLLEGIMVQAPKAQPAIQQQGQKPVYRDTVSAFIALGNVATMETPYAISAVPAPLMENTIATSSGEAMKYVPTVQSETGGSLTTDYFSLRGFTSSVWTYNVALDGMRSYAPYEPIEDKERIEILTGVNSFFYGVTSPGGMVNFVSKKPSDTTLASATIGLDSRTQKFTKVDLGGLVGRSLAFRANAAVMGGETSVENQDNFQYLGSAALDWKITPDLTWSFNAFHAKRKATSTQAFFMIGKSTEVPDAPDLSKNYGGDYGFTEDESSRLGTSLNWKINSIFSLRPAFRFTRFNRAYTITRRNLANDSGDYTMRIDYQGKNANYVPQGNIFADADFSTGPVKQKVSVGYTCDLLLTKTPYPDGSFVYTSTDIHPAGSDYPPEPDTAVSNGEPWRKTEKLRTSSILLSDYLTYGRATLALGMNYSSISDSTWAAATGKETDAYDKGSVSPTAAILLKPAEQATLYFSYNQGLQKGSTAPATAANANEVLSPFISRQWEFGLKYNTGKLELSTAFFRIDAANAYTDPATNVYSRDGREIHAGVEGIVFGELLNNLTVFGGGTLLKATVLKATNTAIQGKTPQGVAEVNGRLRAEYRLPWLRTLFVSGGASYTGKEWVDAKNTLSIPAVILSDAGVRYENRFMNHPLALIVNVDNITDESYWTTRSGILYPGSSRTYSAAIRMNWF
jgi:iron complex outermembrane recepter protein